MRIWTLNWRVDCISIFFMRKSLYEIAAFFSLHFEFLFYFASTVDAQFCMILADYRDWNLEKEAEDEIDICICLHTEYTLRLRQTVRQRNNLCERNDSGKIAYNRLRFVYFTWFTIRFRMSHSRSNGIRKKVERDWNIKEQTNTFLCFNWRDFISTSPPHSCPCAITRFADCLLPAFEYILSIYAFAVPR